MKRLFMLLGLFSQFFGKAQNDNYDGYPVYNGNDLGLVYSPQRSVFRVWGPTATKMQLTLYAEGSGGAPLQTIEMQKGEGGTWIASLNGNQEKKFYTFRAFIGDKWMNEVPDPYAKAVGVNGLRAMVIDLHRSNPAGWTTDKSPAFRNATDAVIYELHVRDASIAANSGIINKGKFLGLTETGTKNPAGLSTGIDHLKQLGVTHIHLLPSFDFNSVDEAKPDKPQYNWGYDPQNYNAPEGSYATNANDGITRIREFKQLIQAFHKNGLRVIMDVVYNHTSQTDQSNFNQLVPGYYYRHEKNGKFSNATGCGNETASERTMMRKFMLESVLYWAKEYHVDGFRFDLMGVHDIQTMNLISKELHQVDPGILLYGEGWTAGASPLPDSLRAIKKNAYLLDRIAVFSDDIRDGIKGSVFDYADKGFASGKAGMEESVKFGIVASCQHPQVNYSKVNYSKAPYASAPSNTITYCECHDDHTLWDKLAVSARQSGAEERKNMQQLALSIVLTSQGIPFLHAGTEMLRTKKGVENSFQSPDSINQIDWNQLTTNKDVFVYVQSLIAMRRAHPAFRMTTAAEVAKNIRFIDNLAAGVIGYEINSAAVHDSWKGILVYFNGSDRQQSIPIDEKRWQQAAVMSNLYVSSGIIKGPLLLSAYSCTILYRK